MLQSGLSLWLHKFVLFCFSEFDRPPDPKLASSWDLRDTKPLTSAGTPAPPGTPPYSHRPPGPRGAQTKKKCALTVLAKKKGERA